MGQCKKAMLCAAMISALTGAGPEQVLRLYPGTAQGSKGSHAAEVDEAGRVRNVTVPTLLVFSPPPAVATDLVVLVLPGGGFEHLSIANEGTEVAKSLSQHGITAIILKYRVSDRLPAEHAPSHDKPAPPRHFDTVNSSARAQLAMTDGDNAMRFIRAHAAQWHVSPSRIGVLGFSAGAVIAMHLAVSPDAETRPDFAASLYGALPPGSLVPAGAPPVFIAVAADDKLVGPAGSLPIFEAWRAAGHDAEIHIFQSGGHGFGMKIQHTTSDHWFDDYLWWLRARGLLKLP